jgi:hypothetical protein
VYFGKFVVEEPAEQKGRRALGNIDTGKDAQIVEMVMQKGTEKAKGSRLSALFPYCSLADFG